MKICPYAMPGDPATFIPREVKDKKVSDKGFIKNTNFLMSHCFKEPICPHWSSDYVANCCKGIPWDMALPKCTRFPKVKADA
jgi:hypothetical protein